MGRTKGVKGETWEGGQKRDRLEEQVRLREMLKMQTLLQTIEEDN